MKILQIIPTLSLLLTFNLMAFDPFSFDMVKDILNPNITEKDRLDRYNKTYRSSDVDQKKIIKTLLRLNKLPLKNKEDVDTRANLIGGLLQKLDRSKLRLNQPLYCFFLDFTETNQNIKDYSVQVNLSILKEFDYSFERKCHKRDIKNILKDEYPQSFNYFYPPKKIRDYDGSICKSEACINKALAKQAVRVSCDIRNIIGEIIQNFEGSNIEESKKLNREFYTFNKEFGANCKTKYIFEYIPNVGLVAQNISYRKGRTKDIQLKFDKGTTLEDLKKSYSNVKPINPACTKERVMKKLKEKLKESINTKDNFVDNQNFMVSADIGFRCKAIGAFHYESNGTFVSDGITINNDPVKYIGEKLILD